jgi:hypothetical protein
LWQKSRNFNLIFVLVPLAFVSQELQKLKKTKEQTYAKIQKNLAAVKGSPVLDRAANCDNKGKETMTMSEANVGQLHDLVCRCRLAALNAGVSHFGPALDKGITRVFISDVTVECFGSRVHGSGSVSQFSLLKITLKCYNLLYSIRCFPNERLRILPSRLSDFFM